MKKFSMDFFDIEEILENGLDCARSKRKASIEEKCVRKGKKVMKAVVEKIESRYGNAYWRIRHVGILGYKRLKWGGQP